MGGGGGGGYFSGDPAKARRDLSDSHSATDRAEYEITANTFLRSLLPTINNRDTEEITERLASIREALEDELESTIDLRFGGSVAKHTHVDGISDVDSLVLLDNCELAEGKPSEAKAFLAKHLRDAFPEAKVREGALAVTITFGDLEIQLLPAVSCKGGVTISSQREDAWAKIRPKEFSGALSKRNDELGGKLVPVIKLAKAVIANFPDSQQITGYHAESLAISVFRNYKGEQSLKKMLEYYFREATTYVKSPIRDSTGQSVHVDEYLGKEGSVERRIISDSFARVTRRFANADISLSLGQLEGLFGVE